MPIVLKVSPADRQVVFHEDQIPVDKKANLNGFVIQKDNPIPVWYENGKIKEYTAGNKWYSSDEVEYSEDKINAFHKATHEPITGFIIHTGKELYSVIEYKDGKIGENRFIFSVESDTAQLMNWVYFLDGHIRHYQEYYPNGFLKTESSTDNNKNISSWYFPNGQLISKTQNENFLSGNPLSEVASLQRLIYDSKGQLVIYWDMRSGKALCIFSDASIRRMTPKEIQKVFDETDKFPYINGGEMPEFKCE